MLLLAIIVLLAATPADAPAPVPADADLRVLEEASRPRTMLSAYLLREAQAHFDARRTTLENIKTPEAIGRRQDELRGLFLKAIGPFPERTPLNAEVVGRERKDGYRVERVVFESRPDHHVAANLYLPDAEPPYPGVLVPCGHSANGKAAETYQLISICLAKNGLAALCYDPIGQGERLQVLRPDGKPGVPGSTTEHTMAGVGALLVGRSTSGYRIWDGFRAMDYLAGRPEIDPERLGCTGNSGGGTMTAYLMALDDRIAVAAPSCYMTSLERLFATIGPQDAEQNITGQVAFGMEHADYANLRAPKPTLYLVGTQDFFDIDGAWAAFRESKLLFGRLGHGERVSIFESDEPHGFTHPRRQASMRWMRRWLLGKDDAPEEQSVPAVPDSDLQCTKTGQVLTDFPDERTVFDLNAERSAELARVRAERFAGRTAEELRDEVKTRLALPGPQRIEVDHRRRIERDGYDVDVWTLATEPGVTVIDRVFRPKQIADPSRPMVVYVGAALSLAAPGGPIERRVKDGEMVAMIEPRGMGETAPQPANTKQLGYFGPDEKEAFLSLHLGRPLLAQRVYDLIQSFRALQKSDAPGPGFHLIGIGNGGPIALHAAALDDRVRSVEVEGSVLSWSAVAEGVISRDQLSSVVPGVLESYDLPDLAAAIAPRPLTIRDPLDPAGAPVPQAAIDSAYAPATAAYRALDAADHLKLRAAEPK
jgi:cephalosporin-C deacetylase-like acetyl esterase